MASESHMALTMPAQVRFAGSTTQAEISEAEDEPEDQDNIAVDDVRRRTNILRHTKILRAFFSEKKGKRKEDEDAHSKNLSQQKQIKENPIFNAATENDVLRIKELLETGSVDLHARGALGETALHIACLFGNTEAAIELCRADPTTINLVYESELYFGEVALHLAIVHRNLELITEFVNMGADVRNPRARGIFFSYGGGGCYYGEYVLSFAVCTGQPDVVQYLVDHGASLTAQDTNGNTALHMVVYMKNTEMAKKMYDHILNMDTDNMLELDRIENNEGFSVVKLAAYLGNKELFAHMMNRRREVHWTFGPITSAVYDLDQIDTYREENSVLELIVKSPHKTAMHLVDVTPVKQILREKWVRFRFFFFLWFFLAVAYMGLLILVVELSPNLAFLRLQMANKSINGTFAHLFYMYKTPGDYARLAGEICIIIGVFCIILFEIRDSQKGVVNFFKSGFRIPIHIFCVATIIGFILHFAGSEYEVIPYSIALLSGWTYTIFFTRGFRKTGPFNVMIVKMIFGDMFRFMAIFLIILMAFASAFHVLFRNLGDVPDQFKGLPLIIFNLVKTMTGIEEYNSADLYSNPYAVITVTLFVIYILFAYVLLINLLIAMMGDTYSKISNEGTQIWKKQVAELTLILEHRLPQRLRGRTGTCGGEFGFLAHKWYIRVEEYNTDYDKREVDVNDNSSRFTAAMSESGNAKRSRRNTGSILQKKKSFATYNMFGKRKGAKPKFGKGSRVSPSPGSDPSDEVREDDPELLRAKQGPRKSVSSSFFKKPSLQSLGRLLEPALPAEEGAGGSRGREAADPTGGAGVRPSRSSSPTALERSRWQQEGPPSTDV